MQKQIGPGGEAAAKPARRLSVRSKFLLMMLLTSLLSLGTITWLAYQAGKKALTDAAINQLTSLRAAKKQQIEHYFNSMRRHFRVIGDAPIVAKAIEDFSGAYRELGRQPLSEARLEGLEKFYKSHYLPGLGKNSDSPARLEHFWPATKPQQEVQALYISENPNNVGEKDQLVRHPVENPYTLTHAMYHPWLRTMAERLHFYDVMLIDAETLDVVYTVSKEVDLGQNLVHGPVAGTHFAQLIRDTVRLRRPMEVQISDFGFYPPSYNVPAAFMAAPVFREERLIGVIAGQMSIDALSRFLHDGGKWREQGLGETGQVYLVGSDLLMRSDFRDIIETPDRFIEQIKPIGIVPPATIEKIKAQKTTVLHYPIRIAPARHALLGRTGHETIVNPRGLGAVVAYAPLDIPGLHWVLIARMDENEVLASQIKFNRNVMIAACVLALLATLVALWLARMFLKPVNALLGGIARLSQGERSVSVESRTRDEFDDLVGAFNGMAASIKSRDEVIEGKSRAYEQLLKRIFPEAVALRMKEGEATIAETFPQVTVVYAIIEGIASLEGEHAGQGSIKLLNEIVDRFDTAAESQGVEKVKTIGDHYLAVVGLSVARLVHARRALDFVRLAWRELVLVNQANGIALGLRVGIATGPTHAGLVGSRRFVYDIWGTAPSAARRIVYDADFNAVRVNAEAIAQLPDRDGLGEELAIRTKTMGTIQTSQLRLTSAVATKAAE